MKFLLDTHIWLWSLLEPNKLPPKVATTLQNSQHEFFISPITIWEAVLLAEKKRISVIGSIHDWTITVLKNTPIQEAALSFGVALKSRLVILPHQDPADRFIVETAWEYDLTLMTVDEKLQNIPNVNVFLWK